MPFLLTKGLVGTFYFRIAGETCVGIQKEIYFSQTTVLTLSHTSSLLPASTLGGYSVLQMQLKFSATVIFFKCWISSFLAS